MNLVWSLLNFRVSKISMLSVKNDLDMLEHTQRIGVICDSSLQYVILRAGTASYSYF